MSLFMSHFFCFIIIFPQLDKISREEEVLEEIQEIETLLVTGRKLL